MLEGKEANSKKRGDEAVHWKMQNEQLRAEMKKLAGEGERLEERCQYLESENRMVKRDIQNK